MDLGEEGVVELGACYCSYGVDALVVVVSVVDVVGADVVCFFVAL